MGKTCDKIRNVQVESISACDWSVVSFPSFLLVENYNLNNPIITGDLLCGGLTQASKDTCLKFENGGWTEFSWKLSAKRRFHVSWKRADGKVLAEYSMEFLGIEC